MTAGNFTLLPGQATPYYPLDLQIAGYLANKWHTLELLTIFTSGLLVILGVTYAGSKRIRPHLSGSDLGVIMWFVMCGCIHSFFEGYFAYNYATMAGNNDLFGQLWKEYSLSDSRYLTQNAFVLCMESVTAIFWGPGSFITALTIAYDHPLRYPLQLIVSLGQFYGVVLYYATAIFDHYIMQVTYTRPEAAYYWGYFVFTNGFWVVIPVWLIWQSVSATWSAFAAVNDAAKVMERMGRANGKKVN